MDNQIKYVHTNLIADDWKKLSEFYIKVFDCKPIYPERDLSGEWIDKITGIHKVNIKGIHLKLPGVENVTLEIFEYTPRDEQEIENTINRKGFGHIAFHVDSVEAVMADVTKHGGKQLGELVRKEYEGIGVLTVVYVTDPEGNFVEIQNWAK